MSTEADRPALSACRFGRFRLDPAARRLTDDTGELLPLAGRAFDLLEYLVRHRDRVVGKDELLSAIWPHVVVEENNLNQAVSSIRRALGDSRDAPQYVATVPGRGYRFVAPLQDLRAEAPPQTPPASPLERPPSAGAWLKRPYAYVAIGIVVVLMAGLLTIALRRESAPTALAQNPGTTRATVDFPTLAVLPLHAATDDEAGALAARSLTDLLRNRLASFKDVVVINSASTPGVTDARLATFELRGSVARTGDRLSLDVALVEPKSGSTLWSKAFERSADEVAAMREDVANGVADTLDLSPESRAQAAATTAPVNLDAYGLYVRGQELMSNQTVAEVDQAVTLFRRATILDPAFARGYLALGQAQLLAARATYFDSPQADMRAGRMSVQAAQEVRAEAQTAFDRALELNPSLGEAWIEKAGLERDHVKAEGLYRTGLRLAPNYGVGYMRFSNFLYGQYRKGEALEMIDRAREIDPLTPSLHLRQAFLLMVSRSDIAAHDRLVHEALEINPRLHPALTQLALSRYEYSGEFADGVRFIEQSIALDPLSAQGRYLASRMYLDVDDPAAAMAVLRDSQQPTSAMVEVAQYQRDAPRAASLTRSRSAERWTLGPLAPMAEAVRDEAIATGDFASALKLLESQYSIEKHGKSGLRLWSRGLALVYAHTLVLAGEERRGRELATALVVQIESESVGRAEDWFSRELAAAFAILGEDERALAQLEASARTQKFYRWWYLAELDPLYARLRSDPRFQALAERAKAHRRAQRALVDELRGKGQVPRRS